MSPPGRPIPAMRRTVLRMAAAISLGVLAGCAGDTNPVRDAFVATGIGSEPKPAPDFVSRSRPGTVDYLPVALPKTTRKKARTVAEVKGVEAEMDAVRTTNEAQAAAARAAGSAPAPAPNPAPAAARP